MQTASFTVGSLIGVMVLQVVLILVNAFFAATEIAVLQLNENRLRKGAEEGDKHAKRMLIMVEDPSDFLSTIQIGITLAGFLASAFAADNFADPLAAWVYNSLEFTFFTLPTLRTIAIILITIILSYFTLVFGELVPKQVALHRPYQIARVASVVIMGLTTFMKPLIRLLSASTRVVLRLFGIKDARSVDPITEDEIRMMVDVGHETGAIDSEEKAMIESVFELDKTIARDIMTHRVDVIAIEATAEPEEVIGIIEASGMSRYPVFDGNLDRILGVLNARTYLLNVRSKSPVDIRKMLRPACFVPETVLADVLLRDMQQRKDHMAILLDEYGGFSGIVTMEDIIEEIVGSIYDEFDPPDEPEFSKISDNLWRIAGDTDIETLEQELGVALPLAQDREYDTLGGLVFSQLSQIPADGQEVHLAVHGLEIHTEPVADHHIKWARVGLLPSAIPLKPVEEPEEKDKKETKKEAKNSRKKAREEREAADKETDESS